MNEITVKIDDRGRIWHNGMMYVSEDELYSGHQNKHPENEEHHLHKREFDCDTCYWYENGSCTHVNKNAYYPCLDWLRRNGIVNQNEHHENEEYQPTEEEIHDMEQL